MPGLSIRHRTDGSPVAFTRALAATRHFDRDETTVLDGPADTRVGYTTHPGYPVRTATDGALTVVLEGRLYDRSPDADALRALGRQLLAPDDRTAVREWLLDTDGEFLLCAWDASSGKLALLNDVFGRLPVYYRDDGAGYVASREIQCILAAADDVEWDRTGIAQTLLFGYTLGQRTHWADVSKLPPGSVLRAGVDGVEIDRLHAFDVGRKRHRNRSVGRNARELRDRFLQACRRRSDGDPSVISLSGGHDSRAVAAAFGTAGLDCRAATFARGGTTSRDVSIAREVAAALDLPWDRYDLQPTSTDQARTLLAMKAGLNHVGMGFILGFFERLLADHGPELTYLTGDGGDKTLPDLSPPRQFGTIEDLVDYTVATNSVFPPERAAALAGIPEARLRDSVMDVLASYPERDPADRYVHFLTHERGFNWLFEGEDRNRYYVWSTSPFYAAPFFRYAMNVPDAQKRHNRLYREFLTALWPPAVTFDDADFATPMASVRYDLLQHALDVLGRHPRVEDAVRRIYRGELGLGADESSLDEILAAQAGSVPAGVALGPDRLDNGALAGSRHALWTLLTVLAAVEAVETGSSVFDRHPAEILE